MHPLWRAARVIERLNRTANASERPLAMGHSLPLSYLDHS